MLREAEELYSVLAQCSDQGGVTRETLVEAHGGNPDVLEELSGDANGVVSKQDPPPCPP